MQMNFDLFCVAIVKNLRNWFMKPDQPQAAGGPASAHVHRVKFLPIINFISTFGVCVCWHLCGQYTYRIHYVAVALWSCGAS